MSPEVALLILKVLNILGAGLRLAPELRARKAEYVAQIETMIREDRGPSDDEIGALLEEGDEISRMISEALERKQESRDGEPEE